MTPLETLTLAAYFFILIILAGYGWHRYYLVYAYMKYRDKVPVPLRQFDELPAVTVQLPDLQRDVRRRPADRVGLRRWTIRATSFEVQVLDDSTDETRSIAQLAVRRAAAQGFDISYLHRTDRTGYKAGALEAGHARRQGRVHRDLRRRLPAAGRFPAAHRASLHGPEGRGRAGALGPHQRGLLAADADPVDAARRAFRPRARRAQPRGPLLQLQRHRGHLAPRRNLSTAAAGSTTR